MAINPFRVGELQLPQPLRPVPIDFSPLSQIGESIGQYRQQQQIGDILRGATDESGNLDIQKAASGLGAAGHLVAAQRLIDTATRRAAQQAQETTARRGQDITKAHYGATEAATAAHYKATEDAARDLLEQRREEFKQGKINRQLITDPNTDEQFLLETGGEGGPRRFDLKSGQWQPYAPAPATPAPSTIGPRSDIAPGVMPTASFAERFDPENAPPTRVAAVGPTALPGPTLAPQAAPAVQTAQAIPAVPAQELPRRGEPGGPPLLPSVKEQRSELAKKQSDQEERLVKAGEVAHELKPQFDEAIDAWQQLQKTNRFGYNIGFGQVAASAPARAAAGILKTDEENLRQRFDKAMAAIKARVASADFKGQGAVSNFERLMSAGKFPDLTTSDPAGQLNFLLQARTAADQTVGAAKSTTLGRSNPLFREDAPAVSLPKTESAFDAKTLGQYKADPTKALGYAQRLLQKYPNADPARLRAILNEIHPSLPGKVGL